MTPAPGRPPRLVIPAPLAAAWGDGALLLAGRVRLELDGTGGEMAGWMADLARRYGLEVAVAAGSSACGPGWRLVPPDAPSPAPAQDPGAGYALRADAGGVACRAGGAGALRHSWLTLLQLLERREAPAAAAVPYCSIADRPRFACRMLHLCIFPEMPKDRVRQLVRLAGLLKYSHVVLEFWGTLALETLPELCWREDWCWSRSEAEELAAMARSFGLEVVPMFNALGHAAASRIRWGRHVVLDQDPGLWPLFEPDGWTWCATSGRVQGILRGVLDELMAVAGPGGWVHLGCDEAHSFATCDRCRAHERGGLFAGHVNGLAEHLRRAGRRAIIWGDALLRCGDWPGLTALGHPWLGTAGALGLLDRSIAIADWQYEAAGEVPTLGHFRGHGFDVLASPWFKPGNIRALARAAGRVEALGMLHTTWHRLPQRMEALAEAAQAMWAADPDAGTGGYERDFAAQLAFLAAHARRLGPGGRGYRAAGWLPAEVPVQEWE